MALFMKFVHVVMSFAFVAGLIGRTISMRQASRSSDIKTTSILVQIAGYFERLLVIPGSLFVLGFGLLTAWLQGWPILGFLQGASSNWLFLSLLLSLSMIPIIRFIFLPRGKIFEAALANAMNIGTVTVELQTAFHDSVVTFAHAYELVITFIIIYLMVAKPF